MEERRKYKRYDLSHKVDYDTLSTAQRAGSDGFARTEDVSRGGMKIRVDALAGKGSILKLKIHTPSQKNPLDAEARVVWEKKLPDNSVMAGAAFTRIGWTESDKLFRPVSTK